LRVVHGLNAVDDGCAPSVLSVGNFDGVHRGHQAIVATARGLAAEAKLPVVALTFEPHPISVLRPDLAPERLGTPRQKLDALAAAGVDIVVVAASTRELFAIEAGAFVREVLMARFGPRYIVEGNNFRFGHDRAGDIDTLRGLEPAGGYLTVVVEPVMQRLTDGQVERISSSLVRRLVSAGQAACAAEALGRPYTLTGTVVQGAGRGRKLGFPTANVKVDDVLIPADGVYAGFVDVDGRAWPSAISIGSTPTFAGSTRQVEAHLLGYSADLYGRAVAVHLTEWVRGQQRFASAEALTAQVRADIERVRELTR
jgi:riboflavin kinase/FMN adenylyltransferase